MAHSFHQSLMPCSHAELVKLGLEGTKVRANASRHKKMRYKRTIERDGKLPGGFRLLVAYG